jgi:EF-hand domain pair
MTRRVLICLPVLLSAGALGRAAAPEKAPPPREQQSSLLRQAAAPLVDRAQKIELFQMLSAIVSGSQMGPGEGWFHAGESRYSWAWLRERYGIDKDGRITRHEFTGSEELFRRLDRNGDGAISADDLDWSDSSPFWQQDRLVRMLLKKADTTGDGKISAEEWAALFEQVAKGEKFVDTDSLRQLLFPPQPPRPPGPPPDMPTMSVLLKGLLTAEVGSPFPGPGLNDRAPDFTLKTQKGERLITLSDFRGKKPVVLIFGSFT